MRELSENSQMFFFALRISVSGSSAAIAGARGMQFYEECLCSFGQFRPPYE